MVPATLLVSEFEFEYVACNKDNSAVEHLSVSLRCLRVKIAPGLECVECSWPADTLVAHVAQTITLLAIYHNGRYWLRCLGEINAGIGSNSYTDIQPQDACVYVSNGTCAPFSHNTA
jgi:hypothetical protein